MANECIKHCLELRAATQICRDTAEPRHTALEAVASSAETDYPMYLRKKTMAGLLRGLETDGISGKAERPAFPRDQEGISSAEGLLKDVGDVPELVAHGVEPTAQKCAGPVNLELGKSVCRACLGKHFATDMRNAVSTLFPSESKN